MIRLFKTFTKAQLAGAIGTVADFAVFWMLVKMVGLGAVWSVSLSATVGALINFQLARHWVFRARHGHLTRQAVLFAVGAGISIGLNTAGVSALLTIFELGELASRVLAAGVVAFAFNFPFQRFVVFGRAIEMRENGLLGEVDGD